jgi:hypothetical protein
MKHLLDSPTQGDTVEDQRSSALQKITTGDF